MLGTFLAQKSLGKNMMRLARVKTLLNRFGKKPVIIANHTKKLGNNKRTKGVKGKVRGKVRDSSKKDLNSSGRKILRKDRSSGSNSTGIKRENKQDGSKSKLELKKK
jgi:hypothetical protein